MERAVKGTPPVDPAIAGRIGRLHRTLRNARPEPDPQWALWCRRPKTTAERERVVIEAILTQRASWHNVTLAWRNLAAAGVDRLEAVARAAPATLAALVRPAGFYRLKTGRLAAAAHFFNARGGVGAAAAEPLATLRPALLEVAGVGPETADDILLYALEKPVFVIDEYTRRLARRLGLGPPWSYRHLQALFTASLPADYRLYQDLHALIVSTEKTRPGRRVAENARGRR